MNEHSRAVIKEKIEELAAKREELLNMAQQYEQRANSIRMEDVLEIERKISFLQEDLK